jgi:hypothetical protein
MGINDPNLSSKRSDSTVGNMDKYSVDVALNSLGVCLDGSTPVYWMREGTGDSSDKWLIHLKGGGWCTTDEECAGWVNKGFQSGTGEQSGGDGDGSITFNSDQLPNNITGVGIMSIDPSINPVVSRACLMLSRVVLRWLSHVVTRCHTLPHVATRCHTLPHVATRCHTRFYSIYDLPDLPSPSLSHNSFLTGMWFTCGIATAVATLATGTSQSCIRTTTVMRRSCSTVARTSSTRWRRP